MKNILHTPVHFKEEHALALLLIGICLLFLFYLALFLYTVLDFMSRSDFMPRDVVVYGTGGYIHKKLGAFRTKLFGKH